MATKILFNDNRIIFDGHADTIEECKAITAMCDSLATNENFKTIVYENGHAVFEQVSGGESEMFQALEQQIAALKIVVDSLNERVSALEKVNMEDYLKKSEAEGSYQSKEDAASATQLLEDAIQQMEETLGEIDPEGGSVADILNNLHQTILNVQTIAQQAFELAEQAQCDCDLEPIRKDINNLEGQMAGWSEQLHQVNMQAADALAYTMVNKQKIGTLPEDTTATTLVEYVNEKTNVSTYQLPYTANEIIEKLNKL